MPDDFQQALVSVIPTLTAMKKRNARCPATTRALDRLRSAKPTAPASPPASAAPIPTPSTPSILSIPTTPSPTMESSPSAQSPLSAPRIHAPTSETLDSLRPAILGCTKCPHLVASRTQVVFGVGNPCAELMFVGEAPGADEDEQGEPFVGRAGQLLTKIIQAMGFSREDVFIANVLKCRPDTPGQKSGNRPPRPDEMQTCLPWLEKQIAAISPRVMVALGATAVTGLTGEETPVGRLRGRWLDFRGIPLMVTYHPAYLLRNQNNTEKRKVWEDMLKVLEKLGHPISEKQRKFFT